ncbi:UvrD-helicase domain-containing protein [Eionea flava]
MNTPPIDQTERSRALSTTDSFAVSAPAGSGKTGLLTQRVLALLAQCDEPENVLAITFTKKAAAEMQSRILDALRDAEQQPHEPEADYLKTTWHLARAVLARNSEKQWELFSCPNRLRITTIDSLCRSISQQMPFESKLGHTPEILDNPNVAYQLAARDTLAQLHRNSELQAHLISLTQHVDNKLDTIEQLFIQLLGKRDQWLPVLFQSKDQRHALEQVLADVIEEHLQHTHTLLSPFSSELALLADHAALNFSRVELSPKNPQSPVSHCVGLQASPEPVLEAIPLWLGVAELLLTQKGELRKSANKDIGFFAPSAKGLSSEEKAQATHYKQRYLEFIEHISNDPEQAEALASALHQVRHLPAPHYPDAQWALLDHLTHILVNLAQNLSVAFQQLGKTDYLAVTLAALDALGESDSPSDLALALDYKIQHILVDEFQDTSSTQLRLLERLTAGWQADDGRTLFVVGDAMQSCYRFRDANVGIFLNVREYGIGDILLEPLDLQVNFRSQQHIVDWINRSFSEIFPQHNDSNRGAVRYNPSVSVNAALSHTAVHTHLLAYEDGAPDTRSHEAATVVDIIQHCRQNHANNLVTEELTSDSIAVLVRSRAHAQAIIAALRSANITYQATDIDSLATCMPVLDCLSLTKALLHPNDRLAWLAVLRAPWCALDMADLLALAEYNKTDKQWPLLINSISELCVDKKTIQAIKLSAIGQQKLQRFNKVIHHARQQQKRHRLSHWLHGIWLSLGGPALLLNSSDKDNVHTFFNLLDRYEHGGIIPQWDDLEKAVSDLYAKPSQDTSLESATVHSTVPPVQIMTIHKSKGLEFDHVIIPGLEKGSKSNDKELLLWLERMAYTEGSPHNYANHQLLISPMNATGAKDDPIYNFIRAQQAEKERIEADRVLYVGCTRAIKHLHLLGYVAIDAKQLADEASDTNRPTLNQLTLKAIKPPGQHTLLRRLWPSIINSEENNSSSLLSQVSITHCESLSTTTSFNNNPQKLSHPNKIASLSPHWQAPVIRTNNLLEHYRGNNALASLHTTGANSNLNTSNYSQQNLFDQAESKNKKNINSNNQADLFGDNNNQSDNNEPSPTPSKSTTNNESKKKSTRDNIASPDALRQREQRYIGIVIHLALQHITNTGYKLWNQQRIQQQQLIWQTQLAQKGISPHRLDKALDTVIQAVNHTLNDKTGRWLLDNTHSHSATELERWDTKGQHIIDRTFVETTADTKTVTTKNNNKKTYTRWIIDYKSSQPKPDETIEAFTQQQANEYRSQLERYKTLFKDEGSEIRAGLYFVLEGVFVEV